MRKRAGIGSHTKPNKGSDVTWLTGPDVLANLGTFDLDPCAAPSPRPWPTALEHIELPHDGLSAQWRGRVWLNPPYDETLEEWMSRMARHGDGMALTFARTETDIWQRWIWPYAEMVCFFDGRLYFRFPDGTRAPGNAGGPSALIAYSPNDADHLWYSGIRGAYVKVMKSRGRDALKEAPMRFMVTGGPVVMSSDFDTEREARERAESALRSALAAKNAMQLDCQTAQHQADEFHEKWTEAEATLREARNLLELLHRVALQTPAMANDIDTRELMDQCWAALKSK